MTAPKFYITTAISYPNGPPHVGHAYEALATDAIARFMRLDGYDVYFLTGTDEHGIKMKQTAAREGLEPRALADRNTPLFQKMVAALGCSNDDFIRTTEARHHRSSQEIWRRMAAERRHLQGQVRRLVLGARRGLLRRIRDRGEGRRAHTARRGRRSNGWRRRATSSACRPIRSRCSPTTPPIPEFIGPEERRNEVMSFVKGGLRDLSISRTTFDWGIRVPDDDNAPDVRLGRRADQLHHRRRLPGRERARCGATGRPTSTSSARTSSASTPSIGRRS